MVNKWYKICTEGVKIYKPLFALVNKFLLVIFHSSFPLAASGSRPKSSMSDSLVSKWYFSKEYIDNTEDITSTGFDLVRIGPWRTVSVITVDGKVRIRQML